MMSNMHLIENTLFLPIFSPIHTADTLYTDHQDSLYTDHIMLTFNLV